MQKENITKLNLGNINSVKSGKRILFVRNFINSVLKYMGALLFSVAITTLIVLYLEYVGEPLRCIDAIILTMLLYLSIK